MSINSVLNKRKMKKSMETDNLQDFIFKNVLQDLINKKFKENFNKLKAEVEGEVKHQTDLYLSGIKDGNDGEDGESIKGDKGDPGEKGDGIKGDKGDKGDSGEKPTKSLLKSLIKPLIPKPKFGKAGKKGDKGDQGNDGSPDKPKEVVKKLNTLENVLDVKVLKGLKPILKSIQDSVRSSKGGGGGGMGLPVHQQFNGDGSTTEFTLSYNVAASGNAVMACRYQGQVQHLGDQYTISGKTLTFTFTPANGTKIEITYIRT